MKQVCLLLALLLADSGLAQQQKKPLDKVQVLALLAGGVSSQRVSMLVQERGISFDSTNDYLETLKVAGAEDVLVAELKTARYVKPPVDAPTSRQTSPWRSRFLTISVMAVSYSPRKKTVECIPVAKSIEMSRPSLVGTSVGRGEFLQILRAHR